MEVFRRTVASLILPALAAALVLTGGPVAAAAQAARATGAFEVTSQLGRKLYALPDDAAIGAAQRARAADPGNAKLVLALSLAQANRRQYREAIATDTRGLRAAPRDASLLLERGHRELGLREFRAAQGDLERAVRLDPKMLQAHYHLALAHYFQGQFAAAATQFLRARDLATNDDDLIDCSNWAYVSLRRAREPQAAARVLTRITSAMRNHDPHIAFYLRLIRFYQGALPASQVQPPKPKDPNDTEAELAFDTVTYGLGNWDLYHGRRRAALALFRQVVAGQAWNAWGFIGSETELARRATGSR
ncbi:MAG: tetratricopeptide repeat protein [Terriglobales bacterium]